MDKNVWLSRRALKLHAVILILVPAFMALCIWQVTRAVGGNTLSWAYVFEWPIFAGYAVYMWWRFVHEAAEGTPPASAEHGPGGQSEPDAGRGVSRGGTGRRRRTPTSPPTTSTWRSWPSRTAPPSGAAPPIAEPIRARRPNPGGRVPRTPQGSTRPRHRAWCHTPVATGSLSLKEHRCTPKCCGPSPRPDVRISSMNAGPGCSQGPGSTTVRRGSDVHGSGWAHCSCAQAHD